MQSNLSYINNAEEVSSTDSDGLSEKSCEEHLNEDFGSFSLDTNIENVVKLQNLLQAEKHKFNKEQRSRIFLENIKNSFEADNKKFQKKVDVLAKDKLELEKCKIELELKIKQLQLLLTEEKGKRVNVEEHLRLLKEQLYKGNQFYDMEQSKIKILNSTKDGRQEEHLTNFENKLREQEAIFNEKELQCSIDQQKYQQEIMRLKTDLIKERCNNEECKHESKNEVNKLKNELKKREELYGDKAFEHEKLTSDIKLKDEEIQKLKENESIIIRRLENLVPKMFVEGLENEKMNLKRKLKENEMILKSFQDKDELMNSELELRNNIMESKSIELEDALKKLNNEREANAMLRDENMKLRMDNLSLKKNEERIQQKMKIYEEIHNNNNTRSMQFDIKIEEMKKFSEMYPMDTKSHQQSLKFQKEKLEFEGKMDSLKNELKEVQMHLSIVNEQLKMSEENCARFVKELQISEERNVMMSQDNDKLQRSLRELTIETTRSKTSEDQIKHFVNTMRSFQTQTTKMGLENVLNILKGNNDKLKTVLTQKVHFDNIGIDLVFDHHSDTNNADQKREKISVTKSRKHLKNRKAVELQHIHENIEAHYQLQLNKKLSKLNDYLKKHSFGNPLHEDFVSEK